MKIPKYFLPAKYYKYSKRILHKLYYPQNKLKIIHANFDNVGLLIRVNEDVGRAILAGEFEIQEIQFIKNQLSDDSVFFDIGANVGLFSMIMATKSDDIQVHAFDPIKLNTVLLSASVEINSLKNVVVNQTCIGASEGMVEFSVSIDSAYSSMMDSGRKLEMEKIQVPITTLDRYVDKMQIKKIDFIKIDVEGAEKLVIEGAVNILSDFILRPKLMMVELYDVNLKAFKTTKKEIIDILRSKNYLPFVLDNGVLVGFNPSIHGDKFQNIFFKNNQC